MLEVLGVVEDLHDEGDRGGISHVGGVSDTTATSDDATNMAEGIGNTRPRVPFGGEHTQVSVSGKDGPLP